MPDKPEASALRLMNSEPWLKGIGVSPRACLATKTFARRKLQRPTGVCGRRSGTNWILAQTALQTNGRLALQGKAHGIDMNRAGFFLSDLHLFSRRSEADRYADEIHRAARAAHTIVLGGDIFDFKWSTLPSLEHSVDQAIGWLRDLITPHQTCVFRYLLGNHDAHPLFVARLDALSFELSNLFWYRYVLRLGDCIFLHGDIVDGDADHTSLEIRRRYWEESRQPGRMSHLLYDMVVKTRLHRVAAKVMGRSAILRKITRYLRQLGYGPEHGVRHVYFGHIHRELDNIHYGGLTFHNGGASIKGLSFRIVETELGNKAADE
jgi:UDP-2,3-diacylglucosamine hydrolase